MSDSNTAPDDLADLRRQQAQYRRDLWDKIDALEDRIDQLERRTIAMPQPDGGYTPDERALKIRDWLIDQAEKDPRDTASMDYKTAQGVLPDCSRSQLYEAMRRAAGGADQAQNGRSDLDPVPGLRWDRRQDKNNRVLLDLEILQEEGSCTNITTQDTKNGGD